MPKTKAQLEQELQEARETIERYYNQILEMQKAAAIGIEADPRYKQALGDAEAARQERDMYKGLYDKLTAKGQPGRPVKIPPEVKQQIREKRSQGESIRALAREFGVSIATVQRAIT